MSESKLQVFFRELEEPQSIFESIRDFLPSDQDHYLVCYKVKCESCTEIVINDIHGNVLNSMIVNYYKDDRFSSEDFYISSSTYFGLKEKIYSNRTEYYIGDKYYSADLDTKLIIYIKVINDYLLGNTDLYNFIKSDKTIDFLPEDTFINIPRDAFICDSCKCNIIETDNHFRKCEVCGVKYCYYDGLHSDYRCLKIGGSSNCGNCGV
jgi:hypothetical protein